MNIRSVSVSALLFLLLESIVCLIEQQRLCETVLFNIANIGGSVEAAIHIINTERVVTCKKY
jgi:ATP-dependent protease ClpP protease subunit